MKLIKRLAGSTQIQDLAVDLPQHAYARRVVPQALAQLRYGTLVNELAGLRALNVSPVEGSFLAEMFVKESIQLSC